MRILKQFFDFYLNSSIHVALAVCSLSWIVLIKHDVSYSEKVLLFTFFATITGYNFVKYFGIAKFHHRSLTNALKVIQIFSFFCFLLLCYYALQLQIKTLIFIVVFGIITFLYAIPFIPKKMYLDHQQNLRDVSGLKVYVIALVWAGVTVFLPLIEANINFNADVYFLAFQHFIFVIVLMLPFEIRDLKFDSLRLATIPQKIGVKQTKIIGLVLLIIFFFTEFFKDELSQNEIISTLLVAVITAFFLMLANKKKSYYYSSFWVESIPIIWLLIIMLH
ncbi:MAG: hypothetical protein ACPG41_04730 [Lacinutrix venerupis]